MPEPQANPFDHASRGLLKRAELWLLCWLLKVAVAKVKWVTWLDTRLSVPNHPERVCNTIAHLERIDQQNFPWAIPVEFQAEPDSLMPGREWVYAGLLWLREKPSPERGDRFAIMPVIVNLTGRGSAARHSRWSPEHEMNFQPIVWNFAELDAEAILDQIEQLEAPYQLLAWVSLMKNGGEAGTIRCWLAIANRIGDPAAKADLALVIVFAELTDRVAVWKQALEGFNVMESVTVNAWKAEAKSEAIIGFLEARFDSVPADLRSKIEETTSSEVLRRWVTLAGKAISLDKFRQDAGL